MLERAMAFTFRQLQYFVAVAEQGSVTRAAQNLSISQSSVTEAIKELEGDLGVELRPGELAYLGRADRQLKIRGYRIELGEIEARLHEQPLVRDAAVGVQEGANGKHLVGYLVAADATLDPSEQLERIKQRLRAELPEYMVPTQLMRLAQMPLGPSGKLDTRALPEPVWQQREHVEPRTELQRRIAAIWSEVLGLPRVGLRDDFFELGGHSLLATRIVSRIHAGFGVDLPLRALLLDLGPDDHVLALVVHHVATDGWSMERLLEDVSYTADSLTGETVHIDAAFVDDKLAGIVRDENLSQFIL